MISVDAEAVRTNQRAVWDGVSEGWLRWHREFERGADTVTELLLDLAGVTGGQSVLDVGSGIGEPALSAAGAVGRPGRIVGVDLAPAMVAAARSRAVGMPNVTFVVGDVEGVDLPAGSFDAALARWSLMFAADRVEMLRAVARLLRPGGVLAAAVWGPPEEVPMISLAFRVVSEHLGLEPPPPGPGPFSMSDPDQVRAELEQAGFATIEMVDRDVPFRLASVEAFANFARDVLPPGMRRLLVERCGTVDDAGVWDRFARAAARWVRDDGSVTPTSRSLCVRATAPATS